MFTGIVEEVGTIKSINRGQHSAVLTVRAKTVLEETRIGDSIAVNGICLTVRQLFPDSFAADVMHETLNRSALAQLTVGSAVNLERAMPANGRFGGHIVAGHVDGVGRIANIRKDDTAIWYTIHADPAILRYVVEKRLYHNRRYQPDRGCGGTYGLFRVHDTAHRPSDEPEPTAQRGFSSIWKPMLLENISRGCFHQKHRSKTRSQKKCCCAAAFKESYDELIPFPKLARPEARQKSFWYG